MKNYFRLVLRNKLTGLVYVFSFLVIFVGCKKEQDTLEASSSSATSTINYKIDTTFIYSDSYVGIAAYPIWFSHKTFYIPDFDTLANPNIKVYSGISSSAGIELNRCQDSYFSFAGCYTRTKGIISTSVGVLGMVHAQIWVRI